jgi:hypothetical protein
MISFSVNHPKKRYLYAVTTGVMLGELLVYIESIDNNYGFLVLPIMKNRLIPQDKFKEGLANKIVDIVEKLPKNVFKVCEAQYIKNTSNGTLM